MAAVRQLAGERKGLGSGAQSARQANSLLANLQSAGVDRAALAAAAAAAAAAAIRVVGAPSPPPPLSLSGLALRGEAAAAGADGAMGGRLEAGALHAVVVLALVVRCGARSLRRRRRFVEDLGENGPSEAPRSESAERAIVGALFPPLKAPQRDVRATTRRHSAAVCPRDGPATPLARPRAATIF